MGLSYEEISRSYKYNWFKKRRFEMNRSAGTVGFEYRPRNGSRQPAERLNDLDYADWPRTGKNGARELPKLAFIYFILF